MSENNPTNTAWWASMSFPLPSSGSSFSPASTSSSNVNDPYSSLAVTTTETQQNGSWGGSGLLLDSNLQFNLRSKNKWKERDPCVVERSNLVNILKLVIKEVIDSSLKFGCQLDSDHIPLQHFFIVLEHILQHAVKTKKKGLLSQKKELWDLLQTVEKTIPEAVDITASVRDLPTVKTNLGRSRAWLRLALMQKNLSDYFRCLVEQNASVLAEFYEPQALMRSEEAALIVGLLISLNVVDCNICLKEEDLDSPQGVIDFSLYLRNKRDIEESSRVDEALSNLDEDVTTNLVKPSNITAVLDQKHYIEELNRTLTTNVSNLEAKVTMLTATNALMREDMDVSKKALKQAKEENKKLMAQLQVYADQQQYIQKMENKEPKCINGASKSEVELLKKELNLQTSMKAEMEMAMKLLEKDVHEKQDTIIGLRDQLTDIKIINMDMYSKLQECESEITQKGEMVAKLEAKTQEISRMLLRLNHN